MRIALCDDEQNDLLILKNHINNYDPHLKYDMFGSAEELLAHVDKVVYDLIFLDIEMGAVNGFRAAEIINERQDKPLIVFTTKSSDYTIQGYEVAFRYLMKPISYEQFVKVYQAALPKIASQRITLENNGKQYILSLKDIYYIEVFNHNIKIHTDNEVCNFRKSLKNIENQLEGAAFARPHHSYLVNLEHVLSVTQTNVMMRDGLSIKISRTKKEEFLTILKKFLQE